jgi:sulfur carrier protein ThiS
MVFDPNSGRFRPDVVVVKNDRLVSRESVLGEAVSPGDSIRIVPLYMGG